MPVANPFCVGDVTARKVVAKSPINNGVLINNKPVLCIGQPFGMHTRRHDTHKLYGNNIYCKSILINGIPIAHTFIPPLPLADDTCISLTPNVYISQP